ncbi:MAG: NADPH-dependent FMN reductase [Planctomycetota bacterium]
MTVRLLAFAGSLRADSFNRKLAHAASELARGHGAEVDEIDLRDYRLPIFDQDLEAAEGLPESAVRLREHFLAANGLILAAPEYNGSMPAVLKNTIDWLTRPVSKEAPGPSCFKGKTAALLAASPGGLGGLRGLVHVRAVLTGIGVIVLPGQRVIGQAHNAFDADGNFTDDSVRSGIDAIAAELVRVSAALT